MTDQPTAPQAASTGRPRSARRQFAAATLTFEAFVVLFATLAAYGLRVAAPEVIWVGGGCLMVVLLLLAGLLRIPGGYVAGSLVQLVVLAGGLLVPAMFVVGGIFVLLWIIALRLGGRIDRERVERERAERAGQEQPRQGSSPSGG